MTQHSLRPRDVSGIKEKREPVYQISTLQSLILGNYYGCLYIEDLLKHGDTGIGTFHAVAGELIVIDGHCYRILADGSVLEYRLPRGRPYDQVRRDGDGRGPARGAR